MRKIIFTLSLLILLSTPKAILAQTVASPSSAKVTPTATTSSAFTKSLTVLLVRLDASLSRLERLSQRINSRLIKLNLTDPGQKTLTEKLTKLKTDLAALNVQSQTLAPKTSTKQDHLLFKSQVMVLTKNLKDVYKLELDMIANMKKQATVAATLPIVVAPTK